MSFLLRKMLRPYMAPADEQGDEGGGGINEETGESEGSQNDARVALLNQIADGNDGDRAEELANVNDDDTTEPFVIAEEDQTAAEELARSEEEANQVTEEEVQSPVPQMVTIKVDGKEVTLPLSEVITRAQKVSAADAYLAEAARLQKAAREQNSATQAQPSQADVAAQAEEEERALVRAIQMGTEEEAMAALRKVRNTGPSITQDDLARTVDERLTFKEAVTKLQSEFSDVMGDPVLRNLLVSRDKELLSNGDTRPYWDRYQDIGKEIRDWKQSLIGTAAPVTQEKTVAVSSNKQARKAAVPAAPKSASSKASTQVRDEEQEESVSEVIANIAKQRGGPQWLRA